MVEKNGSIIAPGLEPAAIRTISVFKDLADSLPSVKRKMQHALKSHAVACLEANSHCNVHPQEAADTRRLLNDTCLVMRDMECAASSLGCFESGLGDSRRSFASDLSPVERLPVEILTDIFLLSRSRSQSRHPAVKQGFYVLFNVAQVCRRWRDIALDVPSLWNLIHVGGASEVLDLSLHGVDEMFSRTRSVDPYLIVDLHQAPQELLQRCRSGRLSAAESRCRGVDLCALSDDSSNRTFFQYNDMRTWLMRFSQLERLTLTGCQLDVDPVILSADWQRLTHLHVHLQPGRDLNAFLSASPLPNLQVLVLDCYGIFLNGMSLFASYPNLTDFFLYGAVFWHSTHFTHERLERVCIDPSRYGSDHHAGGFMAIATLPSLTELTIPFDDTVDRHLDDLFRRSRCQLKRIRLISAGRDEDDRREAVARKMSESLMAPRVEYDNRLGNTEMMRELRTRWYERESDVLDSEI